MKKEDIYFKPYREKNDMIELYILPKASYIKKELKKLDENYSFEIEATDGVVIGTITIQKDNRLIKRSSMLKKHENEIFGEESKILEKTAYEFGIGMEVFGKKILTEYYKKNEFTNSNYEIKKAKIKTENGDIENIWFMEPPQKYIDMLIEGKEVILKRK